MNTEETMNTKNDTKTETKNVLHSRLAGTWYTDDPDQLKNELQRYIEMADHKPINNIIALIQPHAGYAYSGSAAAFGIDQIKDGNYDRVIVLGPTHQYPMRNTVSVSEATHYATPLGEVPLDREFINALKEESFATTKPEVHRNEHSVQIQLPLLQTALKNFKLVPIVCGQLDLQTAKKLGAKLRGLIDDKTLLVASSDFTHYGPRFGYMPFREDIPANLEKLDLGAYEFIKQKDPKGFSEYVEDTGATICGRVPIAVLLSMVPSESQAHLLQYTTSGEITGDYANSVSYLAAAFTGKWDDGNDEQMNESENDNSDTAEAYLSDVDKSNLLQLARSTLTYGMQNKKRPAPEDLNIEITAGMKQQMGAFVTLHKKGQLRGCIGEIIPRRELYKAVIDHALNSAFNDHRFRPLQKSELEEVDIEISALSPPRQVDSYKEIVIGKHGVVLQKGMRSSVFLPQVAPEQGWGVEETLTHLAMKAGLPPDAWKEDAQFEVFEAIVFGED